MPPAHGGLVSFILCLGGSRFVPVWLLKVTCSSCMSVMRTLSFFVSCKCARPPVVVVVVVGHPAFVFCFPLFVHPDPPSSTTFRHHHHHRQLSLTEPLISLFQHHHFLQLVHKLGVQVLVEEDSIDGRRTSSILVSGSLTSNSRHLCEEVDRAFWDVDTSTVNLLSLGRAARVGIREMWAIWTAFGSFGWLKQILWVTVLNSRHNDNCSLWPVNGFKPHPSFGSHSLKVKYKRDPKSFMFFLVCKLQAIRKHAGLFSDTRGK